MSGSTATWAVLSYGLAAIGFLILSILLLVSWKGRPLGVRLISACGITTLWAAQLTVVALEQSVPILLVFVAEVLRNAAWFWVLAGFARSGLPRFLVIGIHGVWISLLVAGLAVPMLVDRTVLAADMVPALLSRGGLLLSLLGLVLLEQLYRNGSQSTRHALRYFVVGVGIIFAYDLFLYSQAELLKALVPNVWMARGFVTVLAVPMIAVAARRNADWSLELFVSRQVIFHTTTFVAVGAYLLLMSVGGYALRIVGGNWGVAAELLFLFGAGAVLVSLLFSEHLRRHLRVFISKHFYRNKYDYRLVWLRFIQTLSDTQGDVQRTALRAVAQIFNSPDGVLYYLDESGRSYVPVARLEQIAPADPEGVSVDHELISLLRDRQWIIDLQEYARSPAAYQNIRIPKAITATPRARIVSPMLDNEGLTGFFVLSEPPPPFELNYEDRDLLKTVGRHVATQLAQHQADGKLAQSRQFETYNRLAAFTMHDLKNSIAQLKLVVDNAERHRRNPEFVDDAIATIANTIDRMSRLIEQLGNGPQKASRRLVSLDELVTNAIERCAGRQPVPILHVEGVIPKISADPERLTAVVEHVLRNAQDATAERGSITAWLSSKGESAELSVSDTGHGMDADFLRNRLFNPFDSTKGSKGMGIGAYQARQYVRELGGEVEVRSSPGLGTQFSIRIPVST